MSPNLAHNRRRFIRRTLATSASLGFAAVLPSSGNVNRVQIDPDALKKFRARLKGHVVQPSDPLFDAARRVFYWNPRTERSPALVVKCAHPEDILRAIEFSRSRELEIAVRSGGHSYMGWGTTNGLLLDLSGFKQVEIDPTRRRARVQGGALSGEIARAAGLHGLAPVLGQCPGVGASGLILGGGLGYLSGLYGACCDNLLSANIVTADAQTRSVDPLSNPDLFWGLQGAGGNFGVTTSFEIQLHPLRQVTGGLIHYPAREARRIVHFFREQMSAAPDSFQATLNLTPGERGVFISLCHTGGSSDGEKFLRPFRTVVTPMKDTVQRQEFALLAEAPPATNPDPANAPAFRHVQTVYRDQLSDHVIDIIVDRLPQAPADTVFGISHFMHGQVCRVAPDATAFPLRQSGAVHFRIALPWADAKAGEPLMHWVDDAWQMLRPVSGERMYANFQTHEGTNSARAVYGQNLARLAKLKSKYDPANFFRRNSNVAPRAA